MGRAVPDRHRNDWSVSSATGWRWRYFGGQRWRATSESSPRLRTAPRAVLRCRRDTERDLAAKFGDVRKGFYVGLLANPWESALSQCAADDFGAGTRGKTGNRRVEFVATYRLPMSREIIHDAGCYRLWIAVGGLAFDQVFDIGVGPAAGKPHPRRRPVTEQGIAPRRDVEGHFRIQCDFAFQLTLALIAESRHGVMFCRARVRGIDPDHIAGEFSAAGSTNPATGDRACVVMARRTRRLGRAEIEKSNDRIGFGEAQGAFHRRVVSDCAGPPKTAKAQRVSGDEHVLGCCANRHQLFDFRHF